MRHSAILGLMLSAAAGFGVTVPSGALQERAIGAPRAISPVAIKKMNRSGGPWGWSPHWSYRGRTVSAAQQKRDANKRRNRARHKRNCRG